MIDLKILISFLILLLLCFANAFLSAYETILFYCKNYHIDAIAGRSMVSKRTLRQITSEQTGVLNHILFISGITQLALAAYCLYFVKIAASELQLNPIWLGAGILCAAVLLFDLLPKLLTLDHPHIVLRLSAGQLLLFKKALDPVVVGFVNLGEKIIARFKPKRLLRKAEFTEDELKVLAYVEAQEGSINDSEHIIIKTIIDLWQKNAKDCMVPRKNVHCVDINQKFSDLVKSVRMAKHRRLPVYKQNQDSIFGILDSYAFLSKLALTNSNQALPDRKMNRHERKEFYKYMDNPIFIPETMSVNEIFKNYIKTRGNIVIVLDEYGGMEGIITFKQMLELLLGQASPALEKINGTSITLEPESQNGKKMLTSGSERLEVISEHFGIELKIKGIDTIGGFIFTKLGRIPASNEELKFDGLKFHIINSSKTQIHEILIKKNAKKHSEKNAQ